MSPLFKLQVPHVFGQMVETFRSLHRFSVSRFETQSQVRLIDSPSLIVLNRSVESTQVSGCVGGGISGFDVGVGTGDKVLIGLDVGIGTLLQVPHVSGQVEETCRSLHRFFVSRFKTQSQLCLIDSPFLIVVNRSVESAQVGTGICALEGLVGESVGGLLTVGLSVDGAAIKLQNLKLRPVQANLHSIFPLG